MIRRVVLFIGLCLVVGCGGADVSPGDQDAAGADAEARGAVVRIPTPDDPGPIDPSRSSSLDPYRLLYPCLIRISPRKPLPPFGKGDLASRWEWDRERASLTVVLKEDRLWEDTVRVGPADVVASYRMWARQGRLNPSGGSGAWPRFRGIEAADDSTVRLFFEGDVPFWRILPFLDLPLLPARRIEAAAGADRGIAPLLRSPSSAGPFIVREWRPGDAVILAPNPLARESARPRAGEVILERCPGSDARVVRFDLGGADLIVDAPVFRLPELLQQRRETAVHLAGTMSVEMLLWNLKGDGASRELREAVSLAVNRDRIVGVLLTWRGERCGGSAAGIWEPGGPPEGDSVEVWSPAPRTDLDTARRIVQRLRGAAAPGPSGGPDDGTRLEILYERGHLLRERLVAFIDEDLRLAGLEPVLVPLTDAELRERMRAGRFQAVLYGFRPPRIPDLEPLWASWGTWNHTGYRRAGVDSLLRAVRGEDDPQHALRDLRTIEGWVRLDQPVTFLVYRDRVDLLSPSLQGFRGTLAYPLAGLEEMVWEEAPGSPARR